MTPTDLLLVLAQERTRRALSQRVLAGLAGLYPSTISDYETGRRLPDLTTFLALVDALELTIRIESQEARP